MEKFLSPGTLEKKKNLRLSSRSSGLSTTPSKPKKENTKKGLRRARKSRD
jgi:hypothetical protein